MVDQIRYTPDGKGGYIGGFGNETPTPGATANITPGNLGQVSVTPGVGDTIEYSPDGQGKYVGITVLGGGVGGLYYWSGRGFNQEVWVPYGPVTIDEAFFKRKVLTSYTGSVPPILRMDEADVPHIFWWSHAPTGVPTFHHIFLPDPWNIEGDEWEAEAVSFTIPSDRFVVTEPFKWQVQIGTDNSIHVAVMVFLMTGSYPYLIYFKRDPVTLEWSEPAILWSTDLGGTTWTTGHFSCDLALDASNRPHISYVDTADPPYNPSTGMSGGVKVAVLGPGGDWTHEFVRHWRNIWVYPYPLPETIRYYPKIVFQPGTNNRFVVCHTYHRWRGTPTGYNTLWYYRHQGSGWEIMDETTYITHLNSYLFSVSSWQEGPAAFEVNSYTSGGRLHTEYRLYMQPGAYYPHDYNNRNPQQNGKDLPRVVGGAGTWDPAQWKTVLDYNKVQLLTMPDRGLEWGQQTPRTLNYRLGKKDPIGMVFYEYLDLATNVVYCDLDRSRKSHQPHILFLRSG